VGGVEVGQQSMGGGDAPTVRQHLLIVQLDLGDGSSLGIQVALCKADTTPSLRYERGDQSRIVRCWKTSRTYQG